MTEINSADILQIEPGKKFFTRQARRAHVHAYQTSGESMVAYVARYQLVLSTFKGWVTRYGEKVIPAQFVPVTVSDKNGNKEICKILSPKCVEIHTGDIKIIFPEAPAIEALIQLIRGLIHANPAKSTSNLVLQQGH